MTKESELKNKKLFVLDMDGTIYLGNKLIDGTLDFINKLESAGKQYLFFTNNSSKSSEFYIKKLESMGLNISEDQIMTSGDVTINYLKKYYNGKKIYLMATDIVEKSFYNSGINLSSESADAVVATFDTSLTYEKLSTACALIRNGSDFIATHPDFNCPTENGFIPDCGAICAFITASTGKKPKYLGKPYKETVDFVLERTGFTVNDIVFVGDRLYTDIATAYNHGATGLLVLSGETKIEDVEKSDIKPDFIFDSLKEVTDVL